MRKIIHNLRQKPHHHRKKVAFAVSAGVTSLIALVWVVSIVQHLPDLKKDDFPIDMTALDSPANVSQSIQPVNGAVELQDSTGNVQAVNATTSSAHTEPIDPHETSITITPNTDEPAQNNDTYVTPSNPSYNSY